MCAPAAESRTTPAVDTARHAPSFPQQLLKTPTKLVIRPKHTDKFTPIAEHDEHLLCPSATPNILNSLSTRSTSEPDVVNWMSASILVGMRREEGRKGGAVEWRGMKSSLALCWLLDVGVELRMWIKVEMIGGGNSGAYSIPSLKPRAWVQPCRTESCKCMHEQIQPCMLQYRYWSTH